MILSDKEQKADKQKTQIVMVTQHLSKNTSIEQKDICALFSNLLDNAIEAKPKRIDVIIKQVQGMLMVQVRNDIVEKPRKENGRFLTRKSNQIEHGWGLRSVEAVVEKYFGSIEYLVDDKSFSVNILMNY
jgi:sensor histidine kinase regulating citrate/malate metabolism